MKRREQRRRENRINALINDPERGGNRVHSVLQQGVLALGFFKGTDHSELFFILFIIHFFTARSRLLSIRSFTLLSGLLVGGSTVHLLLSLRVVG